MRYILIDRVLDLDRGKSVRAVKCVTKGESFMVDLPYYPPALVLEALLQAGAILARATAPNRRTVLGKVERAVFPAFAHPGERIHLEVQVVLSRPEGTLCAGEAKVDDRVIGEARFMIVLLSSELAPMTEELLAHRRTMSDSIGVPRFEDSGGSA